MEEIVIFSDIFISNLLNFRFESSPFKDQATVNANWLPMSKAKTPSPRPGICMNKPKKNKRYTIFHANQSSEYNNVPNNYETRLNFIKHHTLMDDNVLSYFSSQFPLYVKTSLSERLSVITVDPNVRPASEELESSLSLYDILFVGTTTGRVLKFVCGFASPSSAHPPSFHHHEKVRRQKVDPKLILIESIQIFEYNIPIRNIIVHQNTGQLIVQSDNQVCF